ncbi:MAG: hypothetical protein HYR85_12875 [Planctomycetes bacterium]|nr:hypothetical protein [Planctomycetota bacterium]MBI3848304.1 hypothetical protein [Planctomycetota bacterium]
MLGRWIRLGLMSGAILWAAASARAANPPWLSVTPPFASTADTVVLTVTGPPGNHVAVAYSTSNLGGRRLGRDLLLGRDVRRLTFNVMEPDVIGPSGAWTRAIPMSAITLGQVFFQAGVWPAGNVNAATLTNGVVLFVGAPITNGLVVVDMTLEQQFDCPSGATPIAGAFSTALVSSKPMKAVTMTTPAPGSEVIDLFAFTPDPDLWMVSSSYRNAFVFDAFDNDVPSVLARFPDGTYTFVATFVDGTTATTTAAIGGAFPGVPQFTSPAFCTDPNPLVMRVPTTIQFSSTNAASFASSVEWQPLNGEGRPMWNYRGTAASAKLPADMFPPMQTHALKVEAFGTMTPSGGRKASSLFTAFTTGP